MSGTVRQRAGLRRPASQGLAGAERERGSLTLMFAVVMVALLALAGLIIDGSRKLNVAANAYAIAQEAARAGAGMVDRSSAYRSGTFRVNQAQAIAAARDYLASVGYRGSVRADGATRIRVAVTVTWHTAVLSLVGIETMSTTGSAVASLVTGVTRPGA
jgi:Flp pilus assembly protein TadG